MLIKLYNIFNIFLISRMAIRMVLNKNVIEEIHKYTRYTYI